MFDFPVVFVDIETTGGSYRSGRVLEIGILRYENGEVTHEYSTLINPESYIPSSITSLTGITEGDVVGKPVFSEIAEEILELMHGAVFIAHNVRFDYSFLKHEFSLLGIEFSPKLFDTVRLSRVLYAEHKGHSLAALIGRHNIPVLDRHRALEDARAILYFSELAFDEHGKEAFDQVVAKQLKTQYLPPNLDIEEINSIGDIPGVYIFKDEANQPIYVGKSITLKKRILSHFSDTASKEVKISQSVHHVEVIPTGSELAALILESKLVKDLQPLYNRQLRRVGKYVMLVKQYENEYATMHVQAGNVTDPADLKNVYGLYISRTKAKNKLDEQTRAFNLCPKLMGLEKTKGACFSYSLGKCRGACIGKESPELYNLRFETAMDRNRIDEWPYDNPIVVPINSEGESVLIDNWMIQGFLDAEGGILEQDFVQEFNVDEYKIIKRFIRENKQFIIPYKK